MKRASRSCPNSPTLTTTRTRLPGLKFFSLRAVGVLALTSCESRSFHSIDRSIDRSSVYVDSAGRLMRGCQRKGILLFVEGERGLNYLASVTAPAVEDKYRVVVFTITSKTFWDLFSCSLLPVRTA